MTNPPRSNYIRTVNIAKGIAIILVVVGHYHHPGTPPYYITIIKVIYKFHMPLFFLLSGYLFSSVDMKIYPAYLKKKIKRLVYPFISVAILFAVAKYISGLFFELHHPITLNKMTAFFVCPIHSFVPMLWFIHALMIIFIIYPLLEAMLKNKYGVFAISLLLYSLSVTNILCLHKVFQSLPYFSLGALLSVIDLDRTYNKSKVLFAIAFGTLLFLVIYRVNIIELINYHNIIKSYKNLALGINGIIICLLLSIFLNQYTHASLTKYLEKIGYFSMSIYLFHTIFLNLPIIVLSQILKINSIQFELRAVIAISSGIIAPLLLEKYLLRRQPLTRRLILGLSK